MYKTKEDNMDSKELKFTITPKLFALFIAAAIAFFGMGMGYLFLTERNSLWGIFLTVLLVCVIGLLYLEKRNEYLLIDTDGVLECDILKKKQYIAWKDCDRVFKDVRPRSVKVTVVQNVRTTEEERMRTGKMVKTNIIMIPWKYFSKEEKARFLEIIAESTLPADKTTTFLEEMC